MTKLRTFTLCGEQGGNPDNAGKAAGKGVRGEMAKKVFVGSISWNTTEQDLHKHFEKFGTILEAKVVTDRESGRSRGFGFVTFEEDSAARQAISEMDNNVLDGRMIRVSEAQERTPRDGGQGRRGGGGGDRDRNGGRGRGGGGGGRGGRDDRSQNRGKRGR